MHGVLRSMLQKLNAYCISRRPMACLKARKMDDNERAAKKIAKRQLRYQQLPMEGSATSPNGGSVLAELASVSSSAVGIKREFGVSDFVRKAIQLMEATPN
jgi:hypothetical protein